MRDVRGLLAYGEFWEIVGRPILIRTQYRAKKPRMEAKSRRVFSNKPVQLAEGYVQDLGVMPL